MKKIILLLAILISLINDSFADEDNNFNQSRSEKNGSNNSFESLNNELGNKRSDKNSYQDIDKEERSKNRNDFSDEQNHDFKESPDHTPNLKRGELKNEFKPNDLSNDKKQLLKTEMEKHRQAMKNIAGIEIVFGEEERNLGAQAKKERSEKNHQIMSNLSSELKAQVKQEFERHSLQVKSITGQDIVRNFPHNFQDNQENNGESDKNFSHKRCQEPSAQDLQKHRQIMESLSPQKREMVKKEMDRHVQEMKNITGVDLPRPKCE
ncbi:MAG: hypothetical protein FJX30_04770 [Alphaproteobacteria bacterium]|nr:hypothetical protein [Alphaproteobacteria bacterium]